MTNSGGLLGAALMSLLLLGFATFPLKASPVDPFSVAIDLGQGEPTITVPANTALNIDFYNGSGFEMFVNSTDEGPAAPVTGTSPDGFYVGSFFDIFVDITLPPGQYPYTFTNSAGTNPTGQINAVTPLPTALP